MRGILLTALIRSDLRRRLQSFRPSRPRFAFQRPAPRSPRASGTGGPRFRRASPYHQFAAVPLRLVFELAQQLAACAFDFDLPGIMHDAGRSLVLQIFLVVSDLARLVTQAGRGCACGLPTGIHIAPAVAPASPGGVSRSVEPCSHRITWTDPPSTDTVISLPF